MSVDTQVTFDAEDPRSLSEFWRDALGYVTPAPPGVTLTTGDDPFDAWDEFLAQAGVPEDERTASSAIEDPDGHGPRVFFQRVPEGKTTKNRVHLDLRVAEGLDGDQRMDTLERECDRLLGLGAKRLRRHDPEPPFSAGFIVMADPEGNEFCLD